MFSESFGYTFQGVDAMGYPQVWIQIVYCNGALEILVGQTISPEKAAKEALETLSQLLLIIDSLNSSLQLWNS